MNEQAEMPITQGLMWQWTASNVIAIYQPSADVDGGLVFAEIMEDPDVGSWHYESRDQMEGVAEFIVNAVNARIWSFWPTQSESEGNDLAARLSRITEAIAGGAPFTHAQREAVVSLLREVGRHLADEDGES